MVKVLTGVQPGQVSEAEAETIATAPTKELETRTPQAKDVDFKTWLEETPEAGVPEVAAGIEAAAEQELAVQEQQEREAIPDIITRRDDPELLEWDRKQNANKASTTTDDDGGLADRAVNMADVFTKDLFLVGLTHELGGAAKDIVQTTGALTPEGTLDRGFLQMMSVVTENFFASSQYRAGLLEVEYAPEVREEEVKEGSAVTKAQSNLQLGQEIHREYQRFRNAQEGRPTDEYTDLSTEQATVLGDMSKEMYYIANRTDPGNQTIERGIAPDGQVTFTVTKHGSDAFNQGSSYRKRMFPKQTAKPSKTPLPQGKLVGEGQKVFKKATGRAGPILGTGVIQQAMRNLNQVANVVDKQRLKILLATALPVLKEAVDPTHPFAVINHVGDDKVKSLQAKNDIDKATDEYAKLVNKLAQSIFGISQERNGANHLTYYMQRFNGRIAPQQLLFDPTSSKTVRFVTRNAVPAKATPGSRIERNLRQMYAMMLVDKADAALPDERERMLERATPQLVRWGKELRAAFGEISDSQVEDMAAAIANGTPLTDPVFEALPVLELSPDLMEKIRGKGEDGQHWIDGVMDFTDYYENKLKGKPHFSYFNAYMDGKTNGLASNGIQMGSEAMAYKTGVLRSQDKRLLDNDTDVRDELKNILYDSMDQGFDGTIGGNITGPLHEVASALYGTRDLNKATTMTFGYGKELESFKHDINEYLREIELNNPDIASSVSLLESELKGGRQDLVDMLHAKYVPALVQVLDKNALKSRALMRSAAYLHALTNELFVIKSSVGSEIAMGGTEATGRSVKDGEKRYTIRRHGQKKEVARPKAIIYETETTAAAVKTRGDRDQGTEEREVGGHAYGGSVPAPVQSLDAATVALTASGRSWNKLRDASNGNPYLHTIYDAFKVDAMGYDVVLDEVNKNWLDASMNWSYLEETQKAVKDVDKKFKEKYENRDDNSELTVGEARQMLWFLELSESAITGKLYPRNLYNKMGKLIELPDNVDGETARDMGVEAAKRIVAKMKKAGYDVYSSSPPTPTVGHLKAFMEAFKDELQLSPRLGRMVNETNEKKKKLTQKIRSDGNKVYQYYAH